MITFRRSTVLALIGLGIAIRLLAFALSRFGVAVHPEAALYPWNLSPILPLGLFGAAVYGRRTLAYAVPLATYALGDLGILALTGRPDWSLYAYQPVVYGSVALVVTAGFLARTHRSWSRIATAAVLSSVLFFVVTNFGVWALGGGTVYPLTTAGLVDCYARALPYFRNTLISMAVFLPLLFSRAGLVRRPVPVVWRLDGQRG